MTSRLTIEATCLTENLPALVKLVKRLAKKYRVQLATETADGFGIGTIRATFVGEYSDLVDLNVEWLRSTRVAE